jgi:hypothetical protein
VSAFPHTAEERFAAAAYYQSLMMVRFVRHRRGPGVFRALIHDITSGQLSAAQAFAQAAGLAPAALELAWRSFVENPGPARDRAAGSPR